MTAPYLVLGLGVPVSLSLMLASIEFGASPLCADVGAVLSGVSNSVALILYGELHSRLDRALMPIIFVPECIAGIGIFALCSMSDAWVQLVFSAVLVAASSALFWRASQHVEDGRPLELNVSKVDMGVGALAVIALLTGFSYGVVRTFTLSGQAGITAYQAISAELLGTLFCTLLLVLVYFLRGSLSLTGQCMIFVVPLVATGMLIISLRAPQFSMVSSAVNTGGFACFFMLMWSIACDASAHRGAVNVTRDVALFYLTSQFGQLMGSLVPARFASSISCAVIYALLLAVMGCVWVRSRASSSGRLQETGPQSDSLGHVPYEVVERICADRFSLSPRELQVVSLLLQRAPYREICLRLDVSENTVKTHVKNVYKKVGVASREELIERLKSIANNG